VFNVSNDGLAALMHVHMLDSDFLLTLPSMLVEALKERCAVRLVSDSEYLVNAIAKRWVFGWRSRGWQRKAGKVVPNLRRKSLLIL